MSREPSETRQRLLDSAIHLIWESSYGATSVDAICKTAGVRKGSFYYFFESKSDLAVAALQADWESKKPKLDAIFSPTVSPLNRLKTFFAHVHALQSELKAECGHVLGCPLCTLGCEISTQDPKVCSAVKKILAHYQKYIESAIRDAQAEGEVAVANPSATAKCVVSYFEGVLVQARIHNDLEGLKDLYPSALQILGVRKSLAA